MKNTIKLNLALLACILINQSSYCQETFPRRIVLDKDTLCLITIPQVKSINCTYSDLARFKELNDSLASQIVNYEKLRKTNLEIANSYEKQLDYAKGIIDEKDIIIGNDEKMLKISNRKVKGLKIQRFLLSASTLCLGILYLKK